MLSINFNHFSIRTDKLDDTCAFYSDLLDLEDGFRPDFKFGGRWLYLNDKPIIHLVDVSPESQEHVRQYLGPDAVNIEGHGSFDHFAFGVKGYPEITKRLKKMSVDYAERVVPDVHARQIFVKDPNGITIELQFAADEFAEAESEATA